MSNQSTGLRNQDQRIEEICNLILDLASGNLDSRIPLSRDNDELDAISTGINMLAEELQATTVSKDYLDRIYNGVIDMLIVLNPDNTIQSVNPTTCRVLSYKEEDLVGQPVNFLFYRNTSQSLQKINTELNRKGYIYKP
jgi:PAS domain-containing protein